MPRPAIIKIMAKAIFTKYISATHTNPPRIKAWTRDGLTALIPYTYTHTEVTLYHMAVAKLVEENNLDWDIKTMVYGGHEDGFIFCFPNSQNTLEDDL